MYEGIQRIQNLKGKFNKAVKVSSDSVRMANRSINRPVVRREAKLRSVTLLGFCLLLKKIVLYL